MAGYRFCRSDDVAELVRAYNTCYQVHFPAAQSLTVDGFKRWVREVDVWPSSCMLATGNHGEPIAVLIGAKRETSNRVVALGVHPDQLRRGHGSHLLSSLGSKLAILGPPRIVAEIPEGLPDARACFESGGYEVEQTYTDFELGTSHALESRTHPLVGRISVAEVDAAGLLAQGRARCWDRSSVNLLKRQESIEGLAVATESRIEAYLLFLRDDEGEICRIERIHAVENGSAMALLGLLLGHLLGTGAALPTIPSADEDEVPFDVLLGLGFRPTRKTIGYGLDATQLAQGEPSGQNGRIP